MCVYLAIYSSGPIIDVSIGPISSSGFAFLTTIWAYMVTLH